jgi:cbb3-type cytochrome oxidase subunit 1
MSDQKITIEFNDKVVRQFLLASVFWGAVGMLVGVTIAAQLRYWQLNFDVPWLTFGRIRPLHTNAVIFAFVGNMMFAGVYYSTQRLVKALHSRFDEMAKEFTAMKVDHAVLVERVRMLKTTQRVAVRQDMFREDDQT